MKSIPVSFNHIALDVADRQRSAMFYSELFGASVVATDDDHHLSFLRLPGSANFADIALHEHLDHAAAYPASQARQAHTGWSVNDPTWLIEAYEYFATYTRVVLCADFQMSLSVMGLDPDGHAVEFQFADADAVEGQRKFQLLDAQGLRDRVASQLVRARSSEG